MEVGLQIFESEEFGEIRTLSDWENPKFCLVDVCRVLDLRVDNVVTSLKGDPYTAGGISLHPITDSLGRTQMVNFVDEPCLYRIIFTSRKPNALKFQDWIFRVVIPSLRKTGFYSLDGATAMPTIAECLPIKEEELSFLDANINLLPLELHAVLEKLKFNSNMLAEIVKFASYCLPGEIWKPIKNFNGRYQVSTKGNVVSFFGGKPRILKPRIDKDGYLRVNLSKDGKHYLCGIHRIVGEAFIPNPENKPLVHHRDDNPANNCVENLEWATEEENAKYAVESGARKSGEKHFRAVISNEDAIYVRTHYIPRHPEFNGRALARKFNVTVNTIYNIVCGKTYKNIV